MQYIESRFPRPPLVMSRGDDCDETTLLIVTPTRLQHRSMTRHIKRMMRWAVDLAARGGRGAVHPTVGSLRMEVKKFGRSYGGGGARARSDGRRWKKVWLLLSCFFCFWFLFFLFHVEGTRQKEEGILSIKK